MAVKPIGTTALTWGSLLGRGNREPIDATQLNYSYTDLLWELNQRTVSYQIGTNNGGSGNYYVGLITAVPYVNEDDNRKDSHYTVDANGNKKLETIDMKGPWYVSYKGTDKGRGTAQNKYGFVPDGNPNTYYADRIVLKQEMDYTLDNGFVRKTQLGTYYTGVGHWYDSYIMSKKYADGLECPDGTYFPTTSYAEIFNDYTYNVATGNFSHSEGKQNTVNGEASHAEGYNNTVNALHAHAEGNRNTVSGNDSHAEGRENIVSGQYAHVEGYKNKVLLNTGHAEGTYTIANNESEHAQGKYNVSDTENSGTLFTIGNGTAEDNRHNVVGIYHNGDINIEGPNTTNHNTGYFKTTVDGSHTETVRGNYTQTIGTSGKNNTCNITVNGNTTNRFNGTSDTRITGATYEGYDSTFISSVTGFKSSYAYNNAFNKVNKSSYNYIGESLGTYVSKSISERSDTNVYLSAPKICIHGDTATDGTYVDISSDVSYVYGRRHTYIGQPVHGGTSITTTIKGTTINENSTILNKTTNTNSENVTGNSTIKVTGNTNLNTGSLNITSGSTNLDLNKTHIHITNELCIKSSTDAYFKGATNTYVGKDQEGNKGTNLYITSSTKGDLTSPTISLNASTKYDENIGNKSVIATGTLTEDITGIVTITNHNNCNTYTYGNSYTYAHGNITDTAEGERLVVTKSNVNVHNLSNSTTSTSGNTYQYTSSNKTDAVSGTRTNITNGNISTTNKANVNITTRGAHTESITNERSVTVGKHDSLIVNSGGRTEKITGEKITQVISGNINAYTDDTHDTRLNTRGTYIETVHAYIGDKSNTSITGNYSVGLGQGIKVSSGTNTTVGKHNKDEASYFAVGIGTSDTNRKNAFWISQGTTAGTNGVGYFSNNTYVYGNTYDPGQYPNNKEDKSWSAVVTYNMYRNSYTYLYNTIDDKFATFGTGTYFTYSIDGLTYTPTTNVFHWKTQIFDKTNNNWAKQSYSFTFTQANHTNAGVMSAEDKRRLDSIKGFTYDNGNTHEYKFNENHTNGDNLHSFHINTDGSIGYTGWTQGFKYTNNASTVTLSYTHYTGNNSSINIPVLNDGNTINQGSANASKAGIVTADQYNKIVSRLTYLEKWCMWQSGLPNNKSTYIWSGTLAQFNSLTSKPSNTTFIISN